MFNYKNNIKLFQILMNNKKNNSRNKYSKWKTNISSLFNKKSKLFNIKYKKIKHCSKASKKKKTTHKLTKAIMRNASPRNNYNNNCQNSKMIIRGS